METGIKKINMGLMGAVFMSANKGCEALGFGFLSVLNKVAKRQNIYIDLYIFVGFSYKTYVRWIIDRPFRKRVLPNKKYENIQYHLAPKNQDIGRQFTRYYIGKCDIVFDFTGGDSFSDLYGKERFYQDLQYKKWVLEQKIPLVLGSQTYGPYNDKNVRKRAAIVILSAHEVFTRDAISSQYVREICGREAVTVTDVAVSLPYKKRSCQKDKKVRIGINVSGLLWDGGYTQNNQFHLKTDYKKYCIRLIKYLLERTETYEVYLVPHVFSTGKKHVHIVDNDFIPCKRLQRKYPSLRMPERFDTPMAAKSFISSMDILVGARMHATIASFSSCIATIPFSYSRKFEGLYGDFDFPYIISGTLLSTDEAVETTISYINSYKEIAEKVREIMKGIVRPKIQMFEHELEKILLDNSRA